MAKEGALVEKNFSSLPASQFADDVLFVLRHMTNRSIRLEKLRKYPESVRQLRENRIPNVNSSRIIHT
jgi:hypothetical protein